MEELKTLVCPNCGGKKFRVLVQQVVYDVANSKGSWKQDYKDLTIDKDEVLEVVCVKCGKRIFEKYVEKPISKKAWEEFWNSYLVDYIMGFEQHVVSRELEDEDRYDKEEAYLRGIAKGMWSIYNLIVSIMVQDKHVKGRKKTYHLTELAEMRVKEGIAYASKSTV